MTLDDKRQKLKKMGQKLKKLEQQFRTLRDEIEALQQAIADEACPWVRDTVLRDRQNGNRYVVDSIGYSYGHEWVAHCTNIRKDGAAGAYTWHIYSRDADNYVVEPFARFSDAQGKVVNGTAGTTPDDVKNFWKGCE